MTIENNTLTKFRERERTHKEKQIYYKFQQLQICSLMKTQTAKLTLTNKNREKKP